MTKIRNDTGRDHANFTVVCRTGKQWEYDIVINTLNDNSIPNQSREETSGGLVDAMPLRATPGPGVWWAVLVPERYLDKARRALSELPFEIETEPDVWDFGPSETVKGGWQIYLWITLVFTALWAIFKLIRN